MNATLGIPENIYKAINAHLLPKTSITEEAGFMFTKFSKNDSKFIFRYNDWYALNKEDFISQQDNYLELSHESRASIIKKAHDTDTCLVEFHSHPSPYPAQFSFADLVGLSEFVPHVLWRLKGKPYAAIVVAPSGFDALVWLDDPEKPIQLSYINTGNEKLVPTNLTTRNKERIHVCA